MSRYNVTLKDDLTVAELIEVLKTVPAESTVHIWCDYTGLGPRLEVDETRGEVNLVNDL